MTKKARTDGKHPIFGALARLADFYDQLSFSVMTFATVGTQSVINLDTYVFSSIQGTLLSIRDVLRHGRVNDAYALLRKLYDLACLNTNMHLVLSRSSKQGVFLNHEINDWLRGQGKSPRDLYKLIKNAPELAEINKILESDGRYGRIRDRCNDHLHFNSYSNVLLNDGGLHLPERENWMDLVHADVIDVVTLHLAYAFYLRDYYMMSSDHMDHLEMGMNPPTDSEYWVAPFIQAIFSELMTVRRPDIAALIAKNTAMHLEGVERFRS